MASAPAGILPHGSVYTTAAGDRLDEIAQTFGTTTEALAQTNALKTLNPTFSNGTHLYVPEGETFKGVSGRLHPKGFESVNGTNGGFGDWCQGMPDKTKVELWRDGWLIEQTETMSTDPNISWWPECRLKVDYHPTFSAGWWHLENARPGDTIVVPDQKVDRVLITGTKYVIPEDPYSWAKDLYVEYQLEK